MSPEQLRTARIVVGIVWIFAIASFFFPLYYSGIGPLGRALFWLLVCVHAVEFLFFLKTYRATGEPLFGHFLRTMAFGIAHHTEVKQRLEGSGEGS